MTLSPGTPIGHYTVIEHVGAEGTTAEVYRARDEQHNRVVAVKLLARANERSRLEAATATALNHPNIVTTFEVIEHDGRLCLVQEWIDGGSLTADLSVAGRLDVRETVRLGRDVASALCYAHQQGILHRDIKPSNVLRSVEGSYKLADFGALGQLQVTTATTRAGEIAGTPLYMSPEQITGAPQTSASDVFGLGLLLYRCLYGRLPHDTADSYVQLAFSRLQIPISVPPSPLQELLEHCLAPDPAQRPQSAVEVLIALGQIAPTSPLQRSTLPAAPWGAAQPSAALPPRLGNDGRTTPAAATPVRGRRMLALWMALAVLTGTVLVAIGLLGAGSPLVRTGAGLAISGVAFAVAQQIRVHWTSRAPEAERRAATILFGAGQREELTRSLMIEVDQVVQNLNSFDATFLGMTVVAMIREYEEARESSERQTALLNVVVLMEKLQARFSPWHVRHKDAIATGVAVVGALAGVAGVVSGFLE